MRPLTEEETRIFFEKLARYIGRDIASLIDRKDEPHCFRLHKDRVYYLSETAVKLALTIPRDNLISSGTCFGKFTKTKKFRLHITALLHLARYAKYKVWIKPNGEMPFLYGNNILKHYVGRLTEDLPQNQGVVIYTMSDSPLGFGVTARSAVDYQKMSSAMIYVYRQADVGEYLRNEDTII